MPIAEETVKDDRLKQTRKPLNLALTRDMKPGEKQFNIAVLILVICLVVIAALMFTLREFNI